MSESELLRSTEKLILNSGDENEYLSNLEILGRAVARSATDHEYRASLASTAILKSILDVMSRSLCLQFSSIGEEVLYVRTIRGLNLLTRNIIVASSIDLDSTSIFLNLRHYIEKISTENPMFFKCLASFLEVLANAAMRDVSFEVSNWNVMAHTFDELLLKLIQSTTETNVPFEFILKRYLESDDNCTMLLTDSEYSHLLDYVIGESVKDSESGDLRQPLISVWENIATNKSFSKWIEDKVDDKSITGILKVCQLVVTNEDDWDNTACTVLMNWTSSLFSILSSQAQSCFKIHDVKELKEIHQRLVPVLDMISDLAKFHTSKQFMQHYNFSEALVSLLRVVHENTEASTLKSRKIEPLVDSKMSFPMVKALIIEILAFICHDSFEEQEKMRAMHGLELVLSNCVIDDDNPYIKERSILCLKFLLHKNPENQKFVAELEAKQVVNGDALQQAGYKVSIEDGNIKVGTADN